MLIQGQFLCLCTRTWEDQKSYIQPNIEPNLVEIPIIIEGEEDGSFDSNDKIIFLDMEVPDMIYRTII